MQFKQEPSGVWSRWHYQLPWIVVSGSRLTLFRASDLTFSFWFPGQLRDMYSVLLVLIRRPMLAAGSAVRDSCTLSSFDGRFWKAYLAGIVNVIYELFLMHGWPLGCVSTPLSWSLILAWHIAQIKTTMKRNGARTPPLRTPVVASKLSDIRPSTKTAVFGTVTQESDCTNDLNSMT